MTHSHHYAWENGLVLPELTAAHGGKPPVTLRDELLVVIRPPNPCQDPWVQDLVERSQRALTRTQNYLDCHIGFFAHGGPYAVLSWKKAGANALERRWVAHKLGQSLDQFFAAKSRVVFLAEGCQAAEIALAEDFLTRRFSSRYDRLDLESVQFVTRDLGRLQAVDPHFASRLRHQIAFRQWVNENPDSLTSIELGRRLQAICAVHGAKFESFDEKQLAELGLNLLVAVGQASDRSPSRLHLATHNLKGGGKPLLLVGKGITFDTGGINLKPHESFVNCMKNDMGGAGLMINLFAALVASGYPGPLALAIPCCENLIDARAMKPGAVIKSFAGKDVFIEHTDAEGRLILADAIAFAQQRLNPALTVVAATLTTASLRQFTNYFTAVHFANDAFQRDLTEAGKAWGEEFTFWGEFLPFLAGNKTNAADLTNMGRLASHASMGGSCNVAAHFLKEFTSGPFVHIDMFASTWNWSGDYPGAHYGATGAPFNSLYECLRRGLNQAWIG